MKQTLVDLYEYWAQPRPAQGAGTLAGLIPVTPVPDGAKRLRPAVLILPGGGYEHVSAREGIPVALRFAARGWAAFVLTYSVAPAVFPAALREAAMAMGYIRRNAPEFGIDPHMVAAMGFSAGGHLCGTLGTLFDAPELADLGQGRDFRPDALGLCYPVAVSWGAAHEGSWCNLCGGDDALRARLSLDALMRPDMPPVFLWHTRDDGSVPVRNSLELASALEKAGVEFAMHIYRQGRHGLSVADETVYPVGQVPPISWDVPGWIEAEIGFFQEIGLKIRDLEENNE